MISSAIEQDEILVILSIAESLAERLRQDIAVMSDLTCRPLWLTGEAPLEIIRCPARIKQNAQRKIIKRYH